MLHEDVGMSVQSSERVPEAYHTESELEEPEGQSAFSVLACSATAPKLAKGSPALRLGMLLQLVGGHASAGACRLAAGRMLQQLPTL